MTEQPQDFSLLSQFSRQGDQAAFGELMRRHLDIVYATAIRKLDDDGAAKEVAQNVFLALARKAWRFSPDDSVPAWLHRTTLLESKHWLRGELRRRRREQTAAELGTTMKTSDDLAASRALLPLLDEALLSLREKDRAALLLRFYEQRPLREVGDSLGVGEDAAQKRVASALERLASFFQRRGFRTASTTAAAAALQQSASKASAATVSSVVQAVLQSTPATTGGITALLARIAAMPKSQAAVLAALLAGAPATVEWHRASAATQKMSEARSAMMTAQTEAENASAQTERLKKKLAEITNANTASDSSVAQDADRMRQAALAFAALKSRITGLLKTPKYYWPSDLPYVRVPKSALKNIKASDSFNAEGKLAAWTKEALNLASDREAAVEAQFADYLGNMDRLAASRATQTNWTDSDGFYHSKVNIPPLGEDGQFIENALSTNLLTMLTPEQLELATANTFDTNRLQIAAEKITHFMIGQSTEMELRIKPGDTPGAEPQIGVTWQGHIGTGGPISPGDFPPFLESLYRQWLGGIGITNGVFKHNP